MQQPAPSPGEGTLPQSVPIDLDAVVLAPGDHDRREDGVDLMELVAWCAGERHSDLPRCASKILGAGFRSWNDDLPDADRQQLKVYGPMLVGTAANRQVEQARALMAFDGLARLQLPTWLELAGATELAGQLADSRPVTDTASADAFLPLLEAAMHDASGRWAAAPERHWPEARAAIGASGGVMLWEMARASRRFRSHAIDAARAASGEACGAAVAAGADTVAVVAKLQAPTHALLRRMIGVASVSAAAPPRA
jgi:hypothetical protein